MIGQTYQTKKNTFFIEKKIKKKLPNSITTFFLLMQFIYGFNFGFINILNKKIRNFCKLISLFICLCTSAIILLCTPIFMPEWTIRVYWGSLCFVQYCGHTILLNFAKYKVYNFVTDVRSVGDGITYSKEHKMGLFACITFGCLFVITVMASVVVCIKTKLACVLDNQLVTAIHMIPLVGLDAIVLVELLVNFYTYFAVIYLAALAGSEEVSFIRKQFLRITECCEKFGKCYENLVSIYVTVAYACK